MSVFGDLIRWFSGGTDGYMSLIHCMKGDTFWITLTVILDLAVALGYVLIARHWWENEKLLPASQAKLALGSMKRIFLFCGMCGYLFIPIKMFWPAWRLYDLFMIALVFFTWRYALNARQLRVVYHELGRNKQLAYELEESRVQSRRKSFFLNAISHDLRTPLNGLMLQADLAELSVSSDDIESLRESLREIKACARTTADLLGSFLELGRIDWSDDPCRESRFLLSELIDQVVDRGRSVAQTKQLELKIKTHPDLYLRTDRLKLERILQNLVGNGIKFTEKGSITVAVDATGRDAILHVIDTGPGIPAEQLETIFEEFYQAYNCERDSTKGFGLGLAISRRLARQLRGEIVVESEPGRGSRFSVILKGVNDGFGSDSSTIGQAPISRGNTASSPLG
jgi:signal transduction histidine kinase